MPRVLVLWILSLLFHVASSLRQWPIQSMADLNRPAEQQAIAWFKAYTVPNTRDANGNPWAPSALPSALRALKVYQDNANIKPAAWATAVAAAWALREGIFNEPDWYRVPDSQLTNTPRCSPFPMPPQKPPVSAFPTWLFSYNLCMGTGVSINPASGTFGATRTCTGVYGKMIGPNEACRPACSHCWQNGIFGMEQTHGGTASYVAGVAEKIYRPIRGSQYTYINVLDNTLTVAGFAKGTSIHNAVMTCCVDPRTQYRRKASELSMPCADLVKMWLVRNHLVGVTLVLNDNPEMFGTSPSDKKYNPPGILVLAKYFNV
ncbi:hypothetical protein B0T10DRAFT_500215 [Thelonectria olida]|uniref:Uncharacterized protein n=1 Tax=Thelonectria olida TaxID=1576542 RepID=A0A9P8VS15_9HYPO|nr:hypothetical protein B0T10DRAFT_500215 [Thelonectria olida]